MNHETAQRYARAAGILLLLSLIAGGFGEMYVPSTLTLSSAIGAPGSLFRWGFAGYLVEALCDVTLSLIFYVLLKPVSKELSLLAAFFGLMGTAVFATAELFYFSTSVVLSGNDSLKAFSPKQLDALAALFFKIYTYGSGALMAFGGAGGVVLGYLILRSGYLPRIVGVLVAAGGLGFIVRNFAVVLAPNIAFDWLLLPTTLAMLVLAVRLLGRGVGKERWNALTANVADA